MSMVIDGTNGLTFNNATTQNSGGKVIQVVNATFTGTGSVSNTSFTATSLTASITPLFSTSKILVIVQNNLYATNPVAYATVYRGSSTNLGASNGLVEIGLSSTWACYPMVVLDSPSTTSSTSYTVYAKSGTGSVFFAGDSMLNTITLMEIAV
jgi:hypothetical protein